MKKSFYIFIATLLLLVCILAGCTGTYKWKTFEEYSAMLADSNTFSIVENDSEFSDMDYSFDDASFGQIRDTYSIETVAGNGGDLSKALNLLAWVSEKVTHDGTQNVNVDIENGYNLLQYAYDKEEKGINCRQKAVILNDCLGAIGIKSKILFLMPKEPNTGDNHVGNIVYISELSKWILVDPSWNAYFQDENDTYLDPFALRAAFAGNATIKINPKAQWNDVIYDEAQDSYYRTYMAKNVYWFKTKPTKTRTLSCAPQDFDLKKWHIDNLETSKKYYDKDIYNQKMDAYKNGIFSNYTKEEILKI